MPTNLNAIKKFKGIVKYGMKPGRACGVFTNKFFCIRKNRQNYQVNKQN